MEKLSVWLLLAVFVISCSPTEYSEVASEKLVVSTAEILEFEIGTLGDEEAVMISKQAQNAEISEIQHEGSTRYVYKSEEGFVGTENVTLKFYSGSSGSTLGALVKKLKLKISVVPGE